MQIQVYKDGVYLRTEEIDFEPLQPTEADTIREEIEACKQELADTDYIALKAYEGEDMTEYGDWKADRHALRVRINALEERLKELND